MSKQRGLGRGFDALIPTELNADLTAPVATAGPAGESIRTVDPADIDPNPHQPRSYFDESELKGLADSITAHGILHPPVVSDKGDGRYELIAGERRVRAARLAGLESIPVIVRSYDEQQKLELALLENVQRSELNPIETAAAYKKLSDEFNLTLDQIGERMGKAKSTVANVIRLLGLPPAARESLSSGTIAEAHARAILALETPEQQQALLDNILAHKWTVRQAEEFVRKQKAGAQPRPETPEAHPEDVDLARALADYLGTKVKLQPTARGGKLVIEYVSDEELWRICETIRPGDVGSPVR